MKQNDKNRKMPLSGPDQFKAKFQNLNSDAKAPEEIENEVFNTLDNLALVGDVFDLFTGKFIDAQSKLIEGISDNDQPIKDEPKDDDKSNIQH